tara:strand:+ start:201 stop:392 length:192 start_codon:yes stop_codon:yes gene_type:complete
MAKKDDKITEALKILFDTSNMKPTPKVEKEIDDLIKKILAKKSRMFKGGLAKKKPVKKPVKKK